jgi:hypothetical protein
MVDEDVNPSYVFFADVDEPHSFMDVLNGEDLQHWKKAMDFEFNLYKTIKLAYLFLFHLITKY